VLDPSSLRFFDARTLATFAAAARCIVPPEPDSPGADEETCLRLADRMLSERPAADQRLLRTFLRALEFLPLFRHGRRFSRLPPDRAAAFLQTLERTTLVARLRAGVFGVKTFALLGYYGSDLSHGELGYPGPRLDAPYYQLRRVAGEAEGGS